MQKLYGTHAKSLVSALIFSQITSSPSPRSSPTYSESKSHQYGSSFALQGLMSLGFASRLFLALARTFWLSSLLYKSPKSWSSFLETCMDFRKPWQTSSAIDYISDHVSRNQKEHGAFIRVSFVVTDSSIRGIIVLISWHYEPTHENQSILRFPGVREYKRIIGKRESDQKVYAYPDVKQFQLLQCLLKFLFLGALLGLGLHPLDARTGRLCLLVCGHHTCLSFAVITLQKGCEMAMKCQLHVPTALQFEGEGEGEGADNTT